MRQKYLLLITVLTSLCLIPATTVFADLPQEIDLTTPYEGVMRIYGDEPGSYIGLSVSSGDIDGDGVDDVIIGALRANPEGRENAGEVFVVFGSPDLKSLDVKDLRESPERVLRIQGKITGSEFGGAVATGDMDGDGYDDILIGALHGGTENRFDTGEAYIVFGSSDLPVAGTIDVSDSPQNVIALYGENPGTVLIITPTSSTVTLGDEFGVAVSTGDINGDGYSDAIVGAWYADPYGREDAGKTYVIFGSEDMREREDIDLHESTSGVLSIAGVGYTLDYPDNSGFYVGAGDINGDSFDDVIVGAKFADPHGKPNTGEVYIVFGSEDIISAQEIDLANPQRSIVRIMGSDPHDYTGSKLNTGDINGDGFVDVLIDAYSAESPDRPNAGRTYVVFGSEDMENGGNIDLGGEHHNVLTIFGEYAEDHLGKPSSGDINGDGIGDLIFQSDCADPGGRQQAGEAYILFGSRNLASQDDIDLLDSTPDIIRISGDRQGSYMGFVSSSGDLDGDGYDDAILGAHGASPDGRSSAGMVYVVWGEQFGGQVEGEEKLIIDAPENVSPGNPFWVDITASNVKDLFGVSFVMKYSQGFYIDVETTEAGDFLGDDVISYFNVVESTFEVAVGITRKAGQEGVNGSGVVARIKFISESSTPEGNAVEFTLDEITAYDAEGLPLSLTGIGSVTVIRTGITVWPGDTNNDGIVNQADILPIGLYWDLTGPARENTSIMWKGQFCQPWTPVSGAYADADGTGKVDQGDVLAIGFNWSKMHTVSNNPANKPENTAGIIRPVPLVEMPISAGEEFRIEIQMEEVHSLFGLSFVLDYDKKESIEPLSVEYRSFLGDDVVFLPQINKSADKVAVGISRKSGQSGVDGSGTIVDVHFKMLKDVTEETTITFSLNELVVTDHTGERIGVVPLDGYIGLKTGIFENNSLPAEFALKQNYPNPFNPVTTIDYTIPSGNSGRVRLDIYDMRGGLVRTLFDTQGSPGTYSAAWDGKDEHGDRISSGMYMYSLQAGKHVITRKMLLVK